MNMFFVSSICDGCGRVADAPIGFSVIWQRYGNYTMHFCNKVCSDAKEALLVDGEWTRQESRGESWHFMTLGDARCVIKQVEYRTSKPFWWGFLYRQPQGSREVVESDYAETLDTAKEQVQQAHNRWMLVGLASR